MQKRYVEFVENDDLHWKEILSLPYQVALNTMSRESQYKFLHRYLANNDFLNKIGISSSPRCSLCDGADESLEHLSLARLLRVFGQNLLHGVVTGVSLLITSQLKKY